MRTSLQLGLLASSLIAGCAARRAAQPSLPPDPADAALGDSDDCHAFDSTELQALLDRRTDSVEHPGNAAELLINGREAWARRYDNARDAELLLVKTFIFADDRTAQQVAELLMERARAGALVVLQYDLKGSLSGLGDTLAALDLSHRDQLLRNKPLMEEMARAGVIVVPTNVPRRIRKLQRWHLAQEQARESGALTVRQRFATMRNINHFDHEKYWITGTRNDDGVLELQAILGGLNVAGEYAHGGTPHRDPETDRPGWRDTDVEVRGPVTEDILRRFFDVMLLNMEVPPAGFDPEAWIHPQPEAGDARVRFVWNQPAVGNRRRIERLYRTLLQATPYDQTVRFEVAYFAPGGRLQRPLRRSLKRGRRVAVLTNSGGSVDVPLVKAASRGAYEGLLRASPTAALYEWLPQPEQGLETLHTKAASFGRCGPAVVGSANLDGQSSEHNSESVVMVRDPEFRRQFDAMFEADIHPERALRVTPAELERTGWLGRTWNRAVYRYAWYWLGF